MDTPVGVVGYGAIGSRMARRLMAAGIAVVSFDTEPQRQNDARHDGAEPLEDAAAVGRCCDIVITCVTDAEAVLDCVTGPSGLAHTLAPGSLVVETTTSTPRVTREVAATLATRRASIIDAPVSRGVPAAENGTLSIMIGGLDHDIDRAEPVLRHLGTDLIRTGRLGTGHIAKAMNMMVMAVNLLAATEAVGLGVKLGMDRTALVNRLNEGPSASFMTTNHYVKYVLSGTFASTFTLPLMLKDIKVATSIAAEVHVPVLLAGRAEQLYVLAATREHDTDDNMNIVRFLESIVGPGDGRPATEDAGDALVGLVQAAALLGTLEASVISREAGLKVDRLLDVLNASSGASAMSRALAGDQHAVPPKLSALDRCAARALELSREHAVAMPLCSSVLDLLRLLRARGDTPDETAAWQDELAELLGGHLDT